MACTLEKVLGDARMLLERLKEHDTAAEGLIEQSGALSQRVHSMKEVSNALPDKVRYINVIIFFCTLYVSSSPMVCKCPNLLLEEKINRLSDEHPRVNNWSFFST